MLEGIGFQHRDHGIEQLRPDFTGLGSIERLKSDVYRLVAARYFIIFLGAVMLISVAAQALWFDGGVSFSRVLKIGLVSILGPGLVWAASDKEVRLLGELDRRNRQLEQRVRENIALNRMTQAHLADCSAGAPATLPAPEAPRMLPAQAEALSVPARPYSAQAAHDHERSMVLTS